MNDGVDVGSNLVLVKVFRDFTLRQWVNSFITLVMTQLCPCVGLLSCHYVFSLRDVIVTHP